MKNTLNNLFFGLKKFFLLWSSQSVSSLGSSMTSYALIIWTYKHQGTALSVSLLAFCTYLPYILFSFIAGTIADKWNKKAILLVCDTIAAMSTVTVLLLFTVGKLEIWHIYIINLIISFMNAFQAPASTVAFSLITPKEQYTRISGMQAFSSSLVCIMTPALATGILAFSSLKAVLIIDLCTFIFAFCVLLFFIRIPKYIVIKEKNEVSFIKRCFEGLDFLKGHRPILYIILFFAVVNLIASIGGNGGILPAMILARSGNNDAVLGIVSFGIGFGTLIGSIFVTFMKPPKSKVRTIFFPVQFRFFSVIFFGESAEVQVYGYLLPLLETCLCHFLVQVLLRLCEPRFH